MNESLFKYLLQEEDYYKMALRKLLKKADYETELIFMNIVYRLKDEYNWEEINQFINDSKII